MPRLWIFSDLHQDWAPNAWDPARHAPADGVDIVVAAGGLHSPLTAAVDWLADRFPGCRVIYVPGNHDFWFDGSGDLYLRRPSPARARSRRPTGRHKYVRPMDTVAMHRASRAFLDSTLAAPFEGPSVVVTPHAPHPASLWGPYADLRWCYASDLSDLIVAREPDLWVHGHVHARRDYRVGATRVVCKGARPPRRNRRGAFLGRRGEPTLLPQRSYMA